jgi:hypothetical protein
MLRRMQTMTPDDLANGLISTSFEACSAFGPVDHGSPVCAGCGWLDAEHAPEPAGSGLGEVHVLPRRRARAVPKRMAS